MTLNLPSINFMACKTRPLWIGTAILAMAAAAAYYAGVRYNSTASLPRGIYLRTRHANLVSVCPVAETNSRLYRLIGSCPDGLEPLLKYIVAKPGDTLVFDAQGVKVNGIHIRNTAPLAQDSKGHKLHPYRFGRYHLKLGQLWIASSYDKRSFDSRYFGPVQASEVAFGLRPILTWN